MADKFDPYREALVMETNTVWGDEFGSVSLAERQRLENVLHASPDKCDYLEYFRVHTGFCRQITVTAADLQRARSAK